MTKTNTFTLLCVVIRVFAIWLVIKLVLGLPALIVGMNLAGADQGMMRIYIVYVIGLTVAAMFWLFAEKFARLALTRPQDHVFESQVDARTWFGMGLSVIGAWYFFGALMDGVHLAGQAIITARMRETYPGTQAPDGFSLYVAGAVVQALLGAGLMLGGQGLAALIHKLRYLGYRRSRRDQPQVDDNKN